jgi:hypothetical protein
MRRRLLVKNSTTTTSVVMDLSLAPTQATRCQHFGRDGLEPGWKNDLKAREDIKEVIMRPIWSRFALQRPKVEIDEMVEACQRAFSNVCSFIDTRDLIQEHIAFRVWPLVESWEMPKETTTDSSDGGLVRLKYTFRFREKFDEPNDDWLKCIEATSVELLGAYSKAEDNALSSAFGGRGKKRLNRVFDAIGFIYPDYCYPLRGQQKKRKTAASATLAEPVLKGKKVKVLTHRSRYIEPAVVPEFGTGSSSAAKAIQTALTAHGTEELVVMPKMHITELAEDKAEKAEELKIDEITKMPKILSLPIEANLPKIQKTSAATPKRRRMANVLDVVLETTKALSPALTKKVVPTETKSQAETIIGQAEGAQIQAEAEAGPSVPIEPVVLEEKATTQFASEKVETFAPEASNKSIEYIIRHASGMKLSQGEMLEARHYAQKLKYPKGALVFNRSNEDDFL